mmetsp:Transcript_25480/g.59334  ORF Transcript_25480/g.59334 Transcript_25480/m.59334 type:complete len:182 (+) Transcript_25480:61-606(+)|eukprot:CAMPEP_0178455578 /NCGR_PEP_ID=MMETSP0689_2-20121128/45987_1 /TAXON_ID=160604 /ORGANISM="Amphidinium massartii, Strain CS-259" /LENGTH=181 /DNA_ID=CAMNT_0020081629 /DNA_START=1 /DNA_END=546 /DNA_ORIENTATION=+
MELRCSTGAPWLTIVIYFLTWSWGPPVAAGVILTEGRNSSDLADALRLGKRLKHVGFESLVLLTGPTLSSNTNLSLSGVQDLAPDVNATDANNSWPSGSSMDIGSLPSAEQYHNGASINEDWLCEYTVTCELQSLLPFTWRWNSLLIWLIMLGLLLLLIIALIMAIVAGSGGWSKSVADPV